ncbi:MAG TPA: AMP-binding protein, partial [Fibrobacteraceae bacterium]|nr:AMP-binding protein [Fibrobacteraceae bacterium]
LPMDSSPIVVKNKVQELSITAWETYIRTLRPMASSWIRTAIRVGSAPSIFSPDGNHFSGTSLAAAGLTFGKMIDKKTPGEKRIAILVPPTAPGIIANLACLIKAKTVINLNYTSPVMTMKYCCDQGGVKTIITAKAFVAKLTERGLDLTPLFESYNILYMEDLKAELSKVSLVRNFIRARLLPAWWIEFWDFKKVSMDDIASILFSSGSEGNPKGVELTHFNLMGNIKQCMSVLNPGSDDVMLGVLPLFHAFGFSITSMMCIVEGVPVVAYPDPTDAKMIGRICAEFKVTIMVGTGTFLRMWGTNRYVHPLMFASVRAVWAGAEKIREELRTLYRTKFQKEIYEGFGTTETTPVAAVNTLDTLLEDYQTVQQGNKPGTVGAPLPGTQFRIVDPDTMEELPIGEDGLILIGGAQIMRGHLNDPERTAQVITIIDGRRWYKTGDKGHVDQDGFLTIVDRYSRFAKLGGEMVSLGSIEFKISESMVLDGIDFCTVSVPDPVKGESIVLLFAGEEATEELVREKVKSVKLPPLMQPSFYIKLDVLPKLGSGKSDFIKSKAVAIEKLASKK